MADSPRDPAPARSASRRVLIAAGAALAVNLLIAVCAPNAGCSIAATCLFAVIVATLFVRDPVAVWLLFPFVLTGFSVLVSLNAIDCGAYILEMGQYGRPTPAAASYACFSLEFLLTSIVVFRWLRRRDERRARAATSNAAHPLFQWAMMLACLAMAAYLLVAGLRTGFPVLSGIDRFSFRRLYADIITVDILNLKVVFAFVLGAAAAFSAVRAVRAAAWAGFVGLVGLSFLYGDKFFIVLTSLGAFMLAFIIRRPASAVRTVIRSAPLLAVGLACVTAVTLMIYSDFGARNLDTTVARLEDRIAGQGELWLMAVEHSSHWLGFDGRLARENLASLVAPDSQDYVFDHHLGAEYFVYKYSPRAMYLSFEHNQGFVTPTMAYEAYGLVMLGYVGLAVLMLLTGAFVGWLSSYLYRTIVRVDLFGVLLPAFLFNGTTKLLAQATLYSVLSLSVFKFYGAILVLQLLVAVAARGLQARPAPEIPAGAETVSD